MNREDAAGATSSKASWLAAPWPELAIVLAALALRLYRLELKPPHFDEGVNGFFVDQMTREGPYHYDPSNFHGPLHFYILFIMQTLFGRHLWALRLPTVLFSTGCVALALGYRGYFGRVTCLVAALGLALSPGMSFYGRYAIHESFMLLTLMGTFWGLLGLWKTGGVRELWATGLGLTGMILTKETYAIHFATVLLAAPALYFLELLSPSADEPPAAPRWQEKDLKTVLAVCFGLIVFFYSGVFLSWGDLVGLWKTWEYWAHTGTDSQGGHVKEWHYWFQLLGRYEWMALAGLALSPLLAWPGTSRGLRYVAIAGGGALVAYALISYKTPWCIIVIIWPFYFVFGHWVERAWERRPASLGMAIGGALAIAAACRWKHPWDYLTRSHSDLYATGVLLGFYVLILLPIFYFAGLAIERAVGRLSAGWSPRATSVLAGLSKGCTLAVAIVLIGHSSHWSREINFVRFTDDKEPYVYVQTMEDVEKLMGPLRKMVAADPVNYHLKGVVFLEELGDGHPLPWLLGDFTRVDMLYKDSPARKNMDADFLLIQDPYVADVEDRLDKDYFRDAITLRGSSGLAGNLYLSAEKFGWLFPRRDPEFQPAINRPAPNPAPAPEPATPAPEPP